MTFIKKLTLFFLVSMITLSSTFSSNAAENKSTEAKDKPQAKWVASNGRWWYDKGDGTYGKSEFIDGYWLDEDGWYVSGWYGKWYQDKSGWWYQSGTWYPRNSWQKIDGSWYYFDANGYMAHSRWLKSGRYWYYLTDTGAMAVSTTIDNYKLDENGRWMDDPNSAEKLIPKTKTAKKTDQIVLVVGNDLSLWEKQKDGTWKAGESMYCGHGKNGFSFPENRRMGDKTTPKGSFELLYAFGKAANPGTSMNYYPITPNSYLSSEKDTYNQWVESETPLIGEHLTDYYQYKYAVNIGFNVNPTTYGIGAGIFLHCKSNTSWNTSGCVSLTEENMVWLLKKLKNGAYMIIVEDESEIVSRDL
ncbi:MAG: L,D-transpeptidase family protein [Eubacterium sp.]|nr:L,D-transpeptidase family protein [Eubacterium sp.]